MTTFIAVISGKGGVGKTTFSLNFSYNLLSLGRRTILVDGDLATPNVGLQLGRHSFPVTSADVISGSCSARDAVCRHSSGLRFIPASFATDASDSHFAVLAQRLKLLEGAVDVVVIDMPSGLGNGIREILSICSHAVIITTPDFPSVSTSLNAARLVDSFGVRIIGAVVNMVDDCPAQMSESEISAMLGVGIVAKIPRSDIVKSSVLLKSPSVRTHPDSEFSKCVDAFSRSLLASS